MSAVMQDMQTDIGLVSTVVARSSLSFIDGEKGVLEYVGYDIDDLARNSTFEETTFLLWNRRLPSHSELADFTARLQSNYDLSDSMWDMIVSLPRDASPMHALRTLTSALSLEDPNADDPSDEANERKSLAMLAKMPALIAGFDRHRKGLDLVRPDNAASIAESFLYMLTGEKPTDRMARAMDICLILHADHGFNASTFASLVTISTLSDMYSAVTTAIGTLKGPLHGGANQGVMVMLQEIDGIENAESFVLDKLSRRDKVMGFGHRVYKSVDPRATYLKTFAQGIAQDTGNTDLFEMSKKIEEVMDREVGSKGIYPNVDFYSATTYFSLGIDLDLFTPLFAMSRVSGWTAHCLEYLQDNRLIRPRCDYIGPHKQEYIDITQR
ncbi:MAG: citrate/2-methylcitrate synthase [Phycisphaerales bacterium]|jgi:citrate synthase|nr:citrate/2-methylcitrate synthase [Phycisphaerales bacterium]